MSTIGAGVDRNNHWSTVGDLDRLVVSGAKLSVRVLEPWMDLSTAQTSTDDCAEVSLTNRQSRVVATRGAYA